MGDRILRTISDFALTYNIENLTTRRKRNLIRYMYQQSQIEMNKVNTQCDKNLRSKKKIMLRYNFSNLTKLHNSPFYRGVKIWNTLPESRICIGEHMCVCSAMVQKMVMIEYCFIT